MAALEIGVVVARTGADWLDDDSVAAAVGALVGVFGVGEATIPGRLRM